MQEETQITLSRTELRDLLAEAMAAAANTNVTAAAKAGADAAKIANGLKPRTAEEQAAIDARNALLERIAKAPTLQWWPPDPEEVDLREYTRLLLRIDDEARESPGYTSDLCYLEFVTPSGDEVLKIDAIQAGAPVYLPTRFLNAEGLTSVRELNALIKKGLCEISPATLDGKTHLPLTGKSAARFGNSAIRAWIYAWDKGHTDPPPLRAAAVIADMVENAQPKAAKLLRNIAGGSRDISQSDKAEVFAFAVGAKSAVAS